jgi:hypothetical protein
MSLLDQLRQEGRLYYVSSSDELVQNAICDIMCKLRKTYYLCAPEYEDNMENIYRSIFSIHSIRERLIYMHGKQVRKPNYAFVAVIMKFLIIRYSYLCTLNELLRIAFGDTSLNKNINKKYYALSDNEESSIKAILLNFSSHSFKPL